MFALTIDRKKDVSMLLVFTMLASMWLAVPAKAGFLQTLGKITKTVVVTGGALAAGAAGAVLGMALGGGPIGMVVGGVAGFIVGKKLLSWATASFANVGTVLGAVAGGVLLAGAGVPLLVAGVVGGAIVGRLAVKLISKITGKVTNAVQVKGVSAEMDRKSIEFVQGMAKMSSATTGAASAAAAKVTGAKAAVKVTTQNSYDRYLAAYRSYMAATQKGDPAAAKAAFTEYQSALAAYQGSSGS
jgi:hypothetical protein